ncbi:MAG: DNA repair protein RecO [Rickettsiales bacterium]
MEWVDRTIILQSLKYGENSLILTLFTQHKGIKKGIVKTTKKNLQNLHIGNLTEMKFKNRLEHHLSSVTIINSKNIYPLIFEDQLKFTMIMSIAGILTECLAENDPHKDLFYLAESLLHEISRKDALSHYIDFELKLLAELGFGLDLKKCVKTGTTKNLTYISPKTGKVACLDAGIRHEDKLFKLPQSFLKHTNNSLDNLNALKILRFFIEKNLYSIRDKKINNYRFKLENLYAAQNDNKMQ